TAFNYQITASGSPTSYGATALAGTGLSINTTTGAITGTPTAAGPITSAISATNASGTGSATLTINVAASSGGSGPTITGFIFHGTNLSFDLTFSEAVTGVDASDFDITTTGSSGAAMDHVADSGDHVHYSVFFTWNGAGPGSIAATIHSSGT